MVKNLELLEIEKDLCSFYDFCRENGFTEAEMKKICSPLTKMIKKTKILHWFRNLLITAIFLLTFYGLLQLDTISWHLSAVGRIALIKILPYWNWKPLFNEKCLINSYKPTVINEFDCVLCESLETIPMETDIDPDILNDLYLDIHVPVIISDGLRDWPMQENGFNISESVLSNYVLANSLPCEFSTNMLPSLTDVGGAIRQSFKFKKWFLHFQNCEFDAIKAFRILSPRPYFLKPEIAPVQYSWLLLSNFYNVHNYKTINLRDRIAIVGQVDGSNYVRLIPRKNCLTECPIFETELKKGEALLFTSLWDFEYKPNPDSSNVAVILETNSF